MWYHQESISYIAHRPSNVEQTPILIACLFNTVQMILNIVNKDRRSFLTISSYCVVKMLTENSSETKHENKHSCMKLK